jgi:hypothetical protein
MRYRPYRVHYRKAEQAARLTRQVLLHLCANLPRKLSCRTDMGNALVQRLAAKLGNQQSDKSFSGSGWQFDRHVSLIQKLQIGSEEVGLM